MDLHTKLKHGDGKEEQERNRGGSSSCSAAPDADHSDTGVAGAVAENTTALGRHSGNGKS